MIKKINLALVVVFALMFVVKMMSDSSGRPEGQPAAARAPQPSDVSEVAPTVYYVYWSGYASENPITNRNGYFLDLIKAIFPKAKFRGFNTVKDLADSEIMTDPTSVYIYDASVASNVHNCAVSASPLCWTAPCLWSLRSSDWIFDESSDSVKNARLGYCRDHWSSEILSILKTKGFEDANLKEYPEGTDFLHELEVKAVDAFVWNTPNVHQLSDALSVQMRIVCRCTPPLGKVYMHLLSVDNDQSFNEALFRDYEAGLKRIRESGERRRIAEYYGFSPDL